MVGGQDRGTKISAEAKADTIIAVGIIQQSMLLIGKQKVIIGTQDPNARCHVIAQHFLNALVIASF